MHAYGLLLLVMSLYFAQACGLERKKYEPLSINNSKPKMTSNAEVETSNEDEEALANTEMEAPPEQDDEIEETEEAQNEATVLDDEDILKNIELIEEQEELDELLAKAEAEAAERLEKAMAEAEALKAAQAEAAKLAEEEALAAAAAAAEEAKKASQAIYRMDCNGDHLHSVSSSEWMGANCTDNGLAFKSFVNDQGDGSSELRRCLMDGGFHYVSDDGCGEDNDEGSLGYVSPAETGGQKLWLCDKGNGNTFATRFENECSDNNYAAKELGYTAP